MATSVDPDETPHLRRLIWDHCSLRHAYPYTSGISVLIQHADNVDPEQILIVLGFNDTPTLVGHFVSSPREREKRDRRDSRGD